MKKLIMTSLLGGVATLLTSCTFDTVSVDRVAYNPGFSNDYVYSVNYYSNRPYWGNNYYYPSTNFTLSTGGYWGYWGGGYYNGF